MAKPNVRHNNREIGKIYGEIARDEKKNGHRRMKVRSLCTHCTAPMQPNLTFKKNGDGSTTFICRDCQQEIDLRVIPEEELKKAIGIVTRACDFIKIMSMGTERDVRLVEEIISEIELKCNLFLMDAYRAAKNNSKRANNHRGGSGHRTGSVSWGSN